MTNSPRGAKRRGIMLAATLATSTIAFPATAAANPSDGADATASCGRFDVIVLYEREYYGGQKWCWAPEEGPRNLPSALHDHVGSFEALNDGCFISESPRDSRRVFDGDVRREYLSDFGAKIDFVAPKSAC
ncbi:hypothetical protein OOZ19_28960 [Saccharopolyspora sp. NFXS83]|uniref:hypothetical protein n=1 Tax=Saccharopolyspora sp. NFXS83 TaxID=2993560 RepID=UPI00224A4F86|nr:hypothetical protein [Saccharopolyspora sp. NFXS83]MCX2734293.1 hypothetical protein [Saccharopolyspora sp. NFXS83]